MADEKKLKAALETLLSRERKGKEAGSGKAAANKSLDCSTDTCRMRRREMEAENRRERESSAQVNRHAAAGVTYRSDVSKSSDSNFFGGNKR